MDERGPPPPLLESHPIEPPHLEAATLPIHHHHHHDNETDQKPPHLNLKIPWSK